MNVTMGNVSPAKGGFSRRPSQMLGFLDHLLTRQRGVCALRTKLLVHRRMSQKTQMPIYLKCMTPVSLFTQLSTRSEPWCPDGQSHKEPEAKSSHVCWFCTLVSIIKNNTEQDLKHRMWKGMILKSLQILKKDVLGLMKVKVTMTIQMSAGGRWGRITGGEAGAVETRRFDTIR